MKKSALLLIAAFTFALCARADESRFDKANHEFAAGNYKAAVADYEAEVASGAWSANLFYDLANAYFRSGDLGRAILNYERALQLDPHHPEAEANLRVARDQTRGLELTPSLFEQHVSSVDERTWTIIAAVFFWLTIFILILRPRGPALLGALACLLVALVSGCAIYVLENGTQGNGAAIVTAENAEARVATADSARSILALPPGSEVVILQQRGDWNYAALPNNQRGWIPARAAEKIRL